MKQHTIVLFEDVYHYHFYPLTLTRPVFALKTGIFSFYERIKLQYPEAKLKVICREQLKKYVTSMGWQLFENDEFKNADKCVFINASVSFKKRHIFEQDSCLIENDRLIYVHPGKDETDDWRCVDFLDGEIIDKVKRLGLNSKEPEHRLFSYPWEMVDYTGQAILEDSELLTFSGTAEIMEGATIFGNNQITAGQGSVIEPGAVVDTRCGPVIMGEGVKIRPLSYVEGPVWIGDNSIIDGAKIRGNSTIDKVCRIGGEVENSIVLEYSNKHHDGFLGHAYVGAWINIGAMTTNSDLRNDYRTVKVTQEGRTTDTGSIKVGCIIGDHCRIGIGVMINTGTVIGTGANLFNSGEIIKKEVPCFVFGGAKPFNEYRLDRFIESVETMKNRRGVELGEHERKLLLAVFAATKDFRQEYL